MNNEIKLDANLIKFLKKYDLENKNIYDLNNFKNINSNDFVTDVFKCLMGVDIDYEDKKSYEPKTEVDKFINEVGYLLVTEENENPKKDEDENPKSEKKQVTPKRNVVVTEETKKNIEILVNDFIDSQKDNFIFVNKIYVKNLLKDFLNYTFKKL